LQQANPTDGVLLTEWVDKQPKSFANQMVVGALMGATNTDRLQAKVYVYVRELDRNKSEINLNLDVRLSDAYGRTSPLEAPPQTYDLFYDDIGAALGVAFPHLAPAPPAAEPRPTGIPE
jgi:hypothetical protein